MPLFRNLFEEKMCLDKNSKLCFTRKDESLLADTIYKMITYVYKHYITNDDLNENDKTGFLNLYKQLYKSSSKSAKRYYDSVYTPQVLRQFQYPDESFIEKLNTYIEEQPEINQQELLLRDLYRELLDCQRLSQYGIKYWNPFKKTRHPEDLDLLKSNLDKLSKLFEIQYNYYYGIGSLSSSILNPVSKERYFMESSAEKLYQIADQLDNEYNQLTREIGMLKFQLEFYNLSKDDLEDENQIYALVKACQQSSEYLKAISILTAKNIITPTIQSSKKIPASSLLELYATTNI